ncbi:hypothetical protein C4J81_11540 [Deltaproteobacteria bacterium Smac51]|nr:hypothetical protein C4J81_11540 [Deltaproteobacteria bacterium Smac51]
MSEEYSDINMDVNSGQESAAPAAVETPVVETVIGAEAPETPRSLTVPGDESDTEGWNQLYKELGRPDSPEDYGLTDYLDGQEVDPQFAGVMGAAMHGAGLSKGQAQKIAAAYQEEWNAAVQAANLQYDADKEEALKSFAPGQIEAARRAFRLSGVSVELAESIERSIGPKAAVEIFSKLGAALAEDRPAQNAEGHGFNGSPEAVRHRIDHLMADPDFCRRYQSGDHSAIREIETLSKRAVPQG